VGKHPVKLNPLRCVKLNYKIASEFTALYRFSCKKIMTDGGEGELGRRGEKREATNMQKTKNAP
jgi:hypothetical protein